jgi:hypothetical protein
MALHVYGVVGADAPLPEMSGVGTPERPLRLVRGDDLAALVSEVSDPEALTEQDAARHLEILSAVAARSTVLPMRFGTAAPDENAVRTEVLAAAGPELRAGLAALDGYVELRVYLEFDEERALRAVTAEHPELRRNSARSTEMDQRIRLGQAVVEALQEWTVAAGDELIAPVVDIARSSARLDRPDPHQDRWALLVARDRVPEVDRAIAGLRKRHTDVDIEYVGPLPVYNFSADTTDDTGSGSRWGW